MRVQTKLGLLAAASIGASVAFLTPAGIAQAHTGALERDCDNVYIKLTQFKKNDTGDASKNNKVSVLRNGTEIKVIDFASSSTQETIAESPNENVTYVLSWTNTGPDHHTGIAKKGFQPVKGCDKPSPTITTPPVDETPAPSAEPTAPGEGGVVLPTTGTSIFVGMVAGVILLVAGLSAMVIARRRTSN